MVWLKQIMEKKSYPQNYWEECKYEIKKIKIINAELEPDCSSDAE